MQVIQPLQTLVHGGDDDRFSLPNGFKMPHVFKSEGNETRCTPLFKVSDLCGCLRELQYEFCRPGPAGFRRSMRSR